LPFLAPLIRGAREGFIPQPADVRAAPPPAYLRSMENFSGSDEMRAALQNTAPLCHWRNVVSGHPDVDPALSDGMHAAHIFGELGILGMPGMRAGLFSLAPNINYPLHSHGAAELYFCLSGILTLRHGVDGTPFQLSEGDYSITPIERTHALSTGSEPVLLFFAWVGALNAPIYWWQQAESGIWERVEWMRDPNGVWNRGKAQSVDPELLAQQTFSEKE
ncbi:MAG: dimethylsulfonioproprionate lyase family protein, partial [Alphaproteobacteria bacterium]|nr:dimethylsulfonioproprionate lyase family protein [Alphaproteobacteria bacterium]